MTIDPLTYDPYYDLLSPSINQKYLEGFMWSKTNTESSQRVVTIVITLFILLIYND